MADDLVTASDAVDYLFDNALVTETKTTRIYELAESIRPGVHRWRVTFLSEEALISIAVNAAKETEVFGQFETPAIYSASFAERLPMPRDFPSAAPLIAQARDLVQSTHANSIIAPGHISLYKTCTAPSDGGISRHDNGCERDQPFRQWLIYLKVTPADGDWFVREVNFSDQNKPKIGDGPRGFFE